MIWTVTTIKDTPEGVRRFVERNLASGVDHMFVFLDAVDAQIYEELSARPHVTPVQTDETYWLGNRPALLNPRRRMNANLVNTLLAPIDPDGWLFHIDGDECLEIDRDAVEVLGRDTTHVNLPSSEAVSAAEVGDDEDTWFKRLLPYEELALLTALGVIDEPMNNAYFNGHTRGKPGLRPRLDRYVGTHGVLRRGTADEVPATTVEGSRVLHYESHSVEQFTRKWTHHVTAGVTAVRPRRQRLLAAVTAVNRSTALSAQRRHELLRTIYERWVADDAALLTELGLLSRADGRLHHYAPRALPVQQAEDISVLLPRLLSTGKRRHQRGGVELGMALARLTREVGATHPDLAVRLARCLREAEMFPKDARAHRPIAARRAAGMARPRSWTRGISRFR